MESLEFGGEFFGTKHSPRWFLQRLVAFSEYCCYGIAHCPWAMAIRARAECRRATRQPQANKPIPCVPALPVANCHGMVNTDAHRI